jgi:hypothetical protein
MRYLAAFITLVLFSLPAFAQPNNSLDGKDVIVNAEESVEICSGTEGITLAVGCTGGGTTYKHEFGTDGSFTLPGTLTVDEVVLPNGGYLKGEMLDGTPVNLIAMTSSNDIFIGEFGGGTYDDIIYEAYDDHIFRSNGANRMQVRDSDVLMQTGAGGSTVATFDSGGLELAFGSASTPSLTFSNDADSGLLSPGVGRIGISSNGTLIHDTSLSGIIMRTGRVFLQDGTIGSGGLTFLSDSDTGLYRTGTNALGVSAGGTVAMTFRGSGNSLPATCAMGDFYIELNDADCADDDTADGVAVCFCESTNTWVQLDA